MLRCLQGSFLCVLMAFASVADEGMWLFNQPPLQVLQERYQFNPDQEWLNRLSKSCVRFSSGGSGSFISEDGLLVSNHHVAADAIQKLSTQEKNLLRDGFHAKTVQQEIKCVDLELNVLDSIEDVTERVNAAVEMGYDPSEAFEARRRKIAEIEKESLDKTGLRSEVVTLWKGGAYHLYRFRRYTDVRLVFAPEQQIAFYGGEVDNFEFPRYDLDVCFLRAYENGKPAEIRDYLKFSAAGAPEGELVFVAGHPARTSRLLTMAELELLRDDTKPGNLAFLKDFEVLLGNWSARSEENARRARDLLLGFQNSRKANDAHLAGLLDPRLIESKEKAETDFKNRLRQNPEFAEALKAYDRIADSVKISAQIAAKWDLLERGRAFYCDTFPYARTLLRAAEEHRKPNGERLKEYSESGRQSLEFNLFSEKPIYRDLEILTLGRSLTRLASELGYRDPLVLKVLAGRSPHERARQLIENTQVDKVEFRKRIYQSGLDTAGSADPMIELARMVDKEARALRRAEEEQGEVRQQAHAAISRARNVVIGFAGYPDATYTLRLAFGTVAGYEENGNPIPSATTFEGLYARANEMKRRPPFDLPSVWEKRKSQLNMRQRFNFITTCDVIGGNSGSPVVNRAGEFVGIIFDMNLPSLTWDYAYNDVRSRSLAIDSGAILEALKQVYNARELVREIEQGAHP